MTVRAAIISGVEEVAELAGQTFGPCGRSVVISRYPRQPLVTQDGRAVAAHMFFRAPGKNMGAAYCREAAAKTKDAVGDGATTTLILLRELLRRGQTSIKAGVHPELLRRALENLLADIVDSLAARRRPPDAASLLAVASQAAKDADLGKLTIDILSGLSGGERLIVRPNPRRGYYIETARPEGERHEVVTVFVGADTDAETKLMVTRLQDALSAARAAVTDGVLPGAGAALADVARTLTGAAAVAEETRAAAFIWAGALTAPLELLRKNAGPEIARLAAAYDPFSVLRTALVNACGIAGLILTIAGATKGRGGESEGGRGRATATLRGDAALAALHRGAETLAAAVAVTMGPRGGQVYLAPERGFPRFTGDGAGVTRAMRLADEFADLGCALTREAAVRAEDAAGDGATTAVILTAALLKKTLPLRIAGWPAATLVRALALGRAHTEKYLAALATPAREGDIRRAAVLAGGEEAGELAAAAFALVGQDGVIKIENSPAPYSVTEKIPGISFPCGYVSPRMVTNPAENLAVLPEALIFLTDRRLTYVEEIEPVLAVAVRQRRPLLVIAADISTDLLRLLLAARERGSLSVTVVLAPVAGARRFEELTDIAVITGGRVLAAAEETDWTAATESWLGEAELVEIGARQTSIIGGRGEPAAIAARGAELREAIRERRPGWTKDKLETRLGWFLGGVARIKVGGMTRLEMLERTERVRDAARSGQSALKTGLLPGGGLALLRAAEALERDVAAGLFPEGGGCEATRAGLRAYGLALREPLRRLAANAGVSGEAVLAKLAACPPEVGFNAQSGRLEPLRAAGVIDAAGVVVTALTAAVSAAALMLNTGGLVAPEQKGSIAPAIARPIKGNNGKNR
ncbi:MAG: chaperonin GroEL [Gracilibacteraceae bacterium]|jgi:chaperonin GroEL|nr:chaperonin GroEL [Gracilibacteraceae bacterium]